MLGMLDGFLTVQALHVAAVLGIADLLASGPQTVPDLAAATGAHRSSLQRLLRMLTGPGVSSEEPDGRFAVTPLGGDAAIRQPRFGPRRARHMRARCRPIRRHQRHGPEQQR
jgi:hypothetical protein